jgi:hypothetical protein
VRPVGDSSTPEEYARFAEEARDSSACYTEWALAISRDAEVLALIDTLPVLKRQPNLVLAAARWHGAEAGPYENLRGVLLERWDDVRETVMARATQTNEVGRCATLLPVLASFPGPLALLEVGASAGLCLYPDRYSYRFSGARSAEVDPVDGPSSVVLACEVHGDPPLPEAVPEVAWRAGLDIHPLDVHDDDAMRWLELLVWPEQEDRRQRLAAAIRLARLDPPPLVQGDAVADLADLAGEAPRDATLVVFHSAVLAYLSADARASFVRTVSGLRGHWVSNEGESVVPGVALAPSSPPPTTGSFVLGVDGRQAARTQGHGRALWWTGP